MKEENNKFSLFGLVKFFAILALIVSVGYFFGSCTFTSSYEMDMISGNYWDFHNAIAGKGNVAAVKNSELRNFAVIIRDGVDNNNMEEIDKSLRSYAFSCQKTCSTENKPYQPTYGYPSYYSGARTVCSYSGCTEETYNGIEHVRKMRQEGVLQKEKLQDMLVNYPTLTAG